MGSDWEETILRSDCFFKIKISLSKHFENVKYKPTLWVRASSLSVIMHRNVAMHLSLLSPFIIFAFTMQDGSAYAYEHSSCLAYSK